MDLAPLRLLSLCAGAGGLDLGVRLALPAARAVCYVEVEAFACEVLASAMDAGWLDRAPLWTDLRAFDGRPWRGIVDCVLAGYPCQPFSVAGRRSGARDPRHLWPEVARVLREVRPPLVFLENVANHLRFGFPDVLADLRALGYRVETGVFAAAEVGAPHLRRRLFALACARALTRDLNAALDDADRDGRDVVGLPPRARAGLRPAPRPGRAVRPLFPPGPLDRAGWDRVLARAPGLAPALEPGVRGVAHGMASRTDRLRLLGNGVVPLVAGHALRTLAARLVNDGPAELRPSASPRRRGVTSMARAGPQLVAALAHAATARSKR